MFHLKVTKTKESDYANMNCVFVHPKVFDAMKSAQQMDASVKYASIIANGVARTYFVKFDKTMPEDYVQMNAAQRSEHNLAFDDPIELSNNSRIRFDDIHEFTIEISSRKEQILTPDQTNKIASMIRSNMQATVFAFDQKFNLKIGLVVFGGHVVSMNCITNVSEPYNLKTGKISPCTMVKFLASDSVAIESFDSATPIFRPDWNFESMGIGGLDAEFNEIFRRAFASRVFPAARLKEMGIKHVKGLLLYGPPGTGKTLIARQIGKMLNGREPKVVNGPEVLSKFVGQSEENVRALFADAEAEQKRKGDSSSLHIIILDELDAICAQRGTRGGGTGVGDTVVNQFLSKIDGVNALNNILLIGMTNRLDMIDDALLRPGRFEVHMEIGLPDESGREKILEIHTAAMRKSKRMKTVDLRAIAEKTKNFTGAELEGLVKSGTSFALQRHVSVENPTQPEKMDEIEIRASDFDAALAECKPAHGVAAESLVSRIPNGIIEFGPSFIKAKEEMKTLITQVRKSKHTHLVSALIWGTRGTGKTAFACWSAINSDFPYARVIDPSTMIGQPETVRCHRIQKVFEDAYKSPLSVVILDDLERLVDYAPIGCRYSNLLLQTLMLLCKKAPPNGHRMLILATSSCHDILLEMGLVDSFTDGIYLQAVMDDYEVAHILEELGHPKVNGIIPAMPIKELILKASKAAQRAEFGADFEEEMKK